MMAAMLGRCMKMEKTIIKNNSACLTYPISSRDKSHSVNRRKNKPSDTGTRKDGPRKRIVVGTNEVINAASRPNFLSPSSPMQNAAIAVKTDMMDGMKTKVARRPPPDNHFREAKNTWKPISASNVLSAPVKGFFSEIVPV